MSNEHIAEVLDDLKRVIDRIETELRTEPCENAPLCALARGHHGQCHA